MGDCRDEKKEDRLSPVSLEKDDEAAVTSKKPSELQPSPSPPSPPSNADDACRPPRTTRHANNQLDGAGAAASSSSLWQQSRWRGVLRSILGLLRLASLAALSLTFGGYAATRVAERMAHEYVLPLIQAQIFTPERRAKELTYFHRRCTADDLTTRRAEDLVIDYETMSVDDAVRHQMKHGASIFPNLLSAETAEQVRNFILRQNAKNEDMIDVIENKNRWSFGMRVDQDPSVAVALHEVLSNPFLVQTIEKVMGPDPAVIEFTGITSAYGAKKQRWHADVVPEGNGVKWGRSFVPSYSLFIPLQNVTGAMGATEVCPGSHMCADGCFDYCPTHGFQVSGEQDRWVQGYGALVNQQTMHLGAAHRDPHGPHRVLFILTFAPRPRYDGNRVETRMIGQGGSYSLHWSQWGHTLRDFRDSEARMRQPWRILRSFGLYKAPGRNWGYDFVTQASARIANNELGFYASDLDAYIQKGGFELLPAWLQTTDGPESEDESNYDAWVPFYLTTLRKCQNSLRRAHWVTLSASVTLLLLLTPLATTRRTRLSSLASGVAAVILIHVVIVLLGWYYLKATSKSQWGENIRYGRAYRWPSLPHPVAPVLPGTLPTVEDVMVFDDLQSDYLGVVSDIMDVTHAGNVAWGDMADGRARGYSRLPPSLQFMVCDDLLKQLRQQGRRLLMKNADGDWAEPRPAVSLKWCHKDLMTRADPTVKSVLRQLDFSLTEAKFGRWRETTMIRRGWITGLLIRLQDSILRFEACNLASTRPLTKTYSRAFSLNGLPEPQIRRPRVEEVSKLPRDVEMLGRSVKVGDVVEAAYESLMTEWYRATVISADSNDLTWGVVYEDGETEVGLCPICVRPFRSYELDEVVGWRNSAGIYEDGHIVGVSIHAGAFDVLVSNVVHKNVTSSVLRRLESQKFIEGSRVVAFVPEEEDWYPGTIIKVNEDATSFGVLFDDGDFLDGVELHHLSPLASGTR